MCVYVFDSVFDDDDVVDLLDSSSIPPSDEADPSLSVASLVPVIVTQ